MRIIRGHDYYDNALSFGQDKTICFVRIPSNNKNIDEKVLSNNLQNCIERDKTGGLFSDKIDINKLPSALNHVLKRAISSRILNDLKDNNMTLHKKTIIIIFCGKIYKALKLTLYGINSYGESVSSVFYDMDSIYKWLNKYNFNFDNMIDEYIKDHNYNGLTYEKTKKRILESFDVFSIQENLSPELMSELIENNISIVTSESNSYATYTVHINSDNLKDYDFYRVMDAYTAYQELSMWVGGILTQNKDGLYKLSDKELIAKHGFDKWSFRKQSQK